MPQFNVFDMPDLNGAVLTFRDDSSQLWMEKTKGNVRSMILSQAETKWGPIDAVSSQHEVRDT